MSIRIYIKYKYAGESSYRGIALIMTAKIHVCNIRNFSSFDYKYNDTPRQLEKYNSSASLPFHKFSSTPLAYVLKCNNQMSVFSPVYISLSNNPT